MTDFEYRWKNGDPTASDVRNFVERDCERLRNALIDAAVSNGTLYLEVQKLALVSLYETLSLWTDVLPHTVASFDVIWQAREKALCQFGTLDKLGLQKAREEIFNRINWLRWTFPAAGVE